MAVEAAVMSRWDFPVAFYTNKGTEEEKANMMKQRGIKEIA